ncbi:MAG: putative metallopeptidase [Candidatus Shapirobacteria bacterium]|nr:putative metallopeptidase [Candidatus Shapirobacteria bacterium]MDD5073713.1 putative metallopeptidase [Candidatus Shapirobacteria bacterium]MDD5481702.1 putative metallopeptidase [Candidatus Shapirobacteria bacterium]
MDFEKARDIQNRINKIIAGLKLAHIKPQSVICFRSWGSSSRALARIWSLPRIWQKALDVPAHYAIEILSEKFDRLSEEEKTKVLIHELLHIPKTFSGALRPHRTGTFTLDQRAVNKLYREYRKSKRG